MQKYKILPRGMRKSCKLYNRERTGVCRQRSQEKRSIGAEVWKYRHGQETLTSSIVIFSPVLSPLPLNSIHSTSLNSFFPLELLKALVFSNLLSDPFLYYMLSLGISFNLEGFSYNLHFSSIVTAVT